MLLSLYFLSLHYFIFLLFSLSHSFLLPHHVLSLIYLLGDRVQFAITFADYVTWGRGQANNGSCTDTYIEIYDSQDPRNDTLLEKTCSHAVPAPFVSTGSALLVRSVFRNYLEETRFSAMYSSSSSCKFPNGVFHFFNVVVYWLALPQFTRTSRVRFPAAALFFFLSLRRNTF